MASRFWVTGGTGNWNSTTNWSATTGGASGASVPGSADTATLNASSGSGTVTLDISPTIQTLTCTGFTGTLAFGTNTISLNSTGTIFTGATTMAVSGTPLIILNNNTASARTVTPGAVTEANSISFRVISGTGSMVFTAGSVRDLDFTDGTNPTGFAGNVTNTANTIYGSFKASTGMTRTAGTQAYTFAATSGTKTINTAGVTFDNPFTFNGVGGTWQLQATLTSGATRTVTLTNGTLDLATYTLTTGLFSSSNSNTRTLAFGTTGKIVLTSTTGNVLSMATATNFTYTGTSRIEVTANGAGRSILSPSTSAVESNALSIYVTTGSDTLTIGSGSRFLDFDLTGFTGTLTYTATSRYFGNLIFSSGMTLGAIGGSFTFAKTSGTQTITSNGKTIGNSVTVDAPGATVSLQDALSLTGTLTLANGTLTTNGYSVAAGIFSSSNTNVRTLNLGASTVTISGTGTVWTILDPTNMTLNAGTSTITTTGNTTVVTFNGGGLTYYNVTFGATYYNYTLSGANTFNNLTVASPAAAGRRAVSLTANQTVNGTLTAVGSAANSRLRLTGATGGSTITAAAVSLSDADFIEINAAGASSPWSGTRLGNGGKNTNITFATPKTVYWNQPAGGNWSDVAWALTSGGAVGANNFPLAQDSVILDNTGVGASSTIVMDYGWLIPTFNASSLTNALTINWNVFTNLSASTYGSVTFSSAITVTYTSGAWGIDSLSGTSIITTAGVSIPIAIVNFNSLGNTLRLGDNFTSTGTSVGFVAGTLDLNGKTLSCVTFDSTFTDLEVRVLAFNGGQIDVTGNAATVWACEDLTNFSYTGTPTVNFTYSGSVGTRTINNGATAGATESNVVDFNCTAGTDTFTFTTASSVRNLNYTGFGGVGTTISNGFIYGNLTLSATQTIAASGNATTFAATSGTKTITTNGVTIDRPLTFNGIGGTWSLQSALTLGATNGNLAVSGGTFNTNNYNITAATFFGSGTSVRAINLGSSTITITAASSLVVSFGVTTNLTFNSGTSTFDLTGTGASSRTFSGGGLTFYKLKISGNAPTAMSGGNNRFQEFSNTAVPLVITFGNLSAPMYFNNFLISGTAGNLVTLQSSTPGTQFFLAKNTGGKVLVSYVSITDSAATPAGYWFAPTSQGNVDGGNNTGWNFGAVGGAGGFLPFF